MFNHVRRHQKWLWILISTLVIISFVYFFNPTAQYGSGGGAGNPRQPVGSIGGRPVTLGEFQDAQREAYIGIFFRYQQWPRNDELTRQLRLVERETQQRLFLIEKLKQYNIEVTDEAIAAWITDVFRNPETKTFAREAYDNFVKVTLPQQGLTQRDLTRFIRHDVAIQHLINVAGASGRLVTPQEAESEFREQNAEVEAQLVVFQATNYMGQVTLDAGALLQHYSNNPALYRIP